MSTKMREHPILFSAPMVRAILDGRKSQTRRIVKPQPPSSARSAGAIFSTSDSNGEWSWLDSESLLDASIVGDDFRCPYGQPGGRLWVRETWQGPLTDDDVEERPDDLESPKYCVYAADGGEAPEFTDADDEIRKCWRPSIHMPRWASRITLEIVAVRVERLQDISEADARAEGARSVDPVTGRECILDPTMGSYRLHYSDIWDRINGAGSWAANPWIWVVEFKRVMP